MHEQAQTYEALTLTLESTVELVGTLQQTPEGKTASGDHELLVDFWRILGAAPSGDDAFTNRLNEVRILHTRFVFSSNLCVANRHPRRNLTPPSWPTFVILSCVVKTQAAYSGFAPRCSRPFVPPMLNIISPR